MKRSATKEPATNRQKKVLRFFGIDFSPEISKGGAGWHIGKLDDDQRILWRKYVYLTGDNGQETDQLQDFDPSLLVAVELPPPQPRRRAASGARARAKRITNLDDDDVFDIVESIGPYDNPSPEIKFAESVFVFTGKFSFGERKECRQAVIEKGGKAEDGVRTNSDYLVVGEKGNPAWKHDNYGGKIAKAINFRHNYGKPAIVSESDWKAALDGGNETPKV